MSLNLNGSLAGILAQRIRQHDTQRINKVKAAACEMRSASLDETQYATRKREQRSAREFATVRQLRCGGRDGLGLSGTHERLD
jgi:hypothetical protein